jgi:hypothetical protein
LFRYWQMVADLAVLIGSRGLQWYAPRFESTRAIGDLKREM